MRAVFRYSLAVWLLVITSAMGNPHRILVPALYRLTLSRQVAERVESYRQELPEQLAAEIEAAMVKYRAELAGRIRLSLTEAFGDEAPERFSAFIAKFSQAEHEDDRNYLEALVAALELPAQVLTPTTFGELQLLYGATVLEGEIESAGRFLGDIESWVVLKGEVEDMPPLQAWLEREVVPEREMEAPTRPHNRLRAAEAKTQPKVLVGEGADDTLDKFGAARSTRRAKALADAQAGMQQVASERAAAEEEAAAKKMAQAQAEAESIRRRAEQLAAVEHEAIEQRRNSWSGRLKAVLTTAISVTSGAFLGNVGSRAGEAAADAVFNTDRRHHHGGHP